MSKSILIAATLLAAPSPLFAQIEIQDPVDLTKLTPTAQDKVKGDWDKIECRAQDVTGSRLERHQVCLTKWQWWANEQEDKNRVYEWQRIGFNVSH